MHLIALWAAAGKTVKTRVAMERARVRMEISPSLSAEKSPGWYAGTLKQAEGRNREPLRNGFQGDAHLRRVRRFELLIRPSLRKSVREDNGRSIESSLKATLRARQPRPVR